MRTRQAKLSADALEEHTPAPQVSLGDDSILFADVLEELGGLVLGNDMQHPKQFRMKAELSQAGKHDVGRVPDSRRDILRPSPEPTGQARGLGLVCSVPDAQSSVIGPSRMDPPEFADPSADLHL